LTAGSLATVASKLGSVSSSRAPRRPDILIGQLLDHRGRGEAGKINRCGAVGHATGMARLHKPGEKAAW
jgi:hypothetical protein